MTTTPFSLPVPGGMLSFTANGLMFTPTGGNPVALPQFPNLQQGLNLPNLNLPNLLPGATGGLPDLSGLLTTLTPIISAVAPQFAPFLPIIGVLFNVAHALSTQMQATAASGTANPALQMVHDAFWSQVLSVFAPKSPAAPTPPAG